MPHLRVNGSHSNTLQNVVLAELGTGGIWQVETESPWNYGNSMELFQFGIPIWNYRQARNPVCKDTLGVSDQLCCVEV